MSAQKSVYTAVNPFFYLYHTIQFFKNDFTVRVTGKYIKIDPTWSLKAAWRSFFSDKKISTYKELSIRHTYNICIIGKIEFHFKD